jgi:hypothetical protein
MVSKKEGTKSGNEDQEYQVESDIANTLPHTAGRSHLELDGRDRGWMRIFCKGPFAAVVLVVVVVLLLLFIRRKHQTSAFRVAIHRFCATSG